MERTRQTSFTPAEHAKHRTTHEVYAAVGAVAAAWSGFEMQIDLSALRLAGLFQFDVAQCFTAQISGSARKLDAYIAVAKERGSATFGAELDKFAKDTAALAERRNRIVHDMWFVQGPEIIARFEVTARRKLRALLVPVKLPEIYQCFSDIADHTVTFRNLDARIQAEVDALPGKPRP